MKHTAIDLAYAMLWNEFKNACKLGSAIINARDTIGFLCERDESVPGVTNVASLLYLKAWPVRSTTTRSKVIDILVKGNESYDLNKDIITQSIVKVQYYSVTNDNAAPLIGVHYDFNRGAQPAHPIFHAPFRSIRGSYKGGL